ncbi:DUF1275 family protein [Dactylosporangium sp. CA-139114]|uniref:YoaK family protein n=1 Tax=Dactylosporangium sp. CA-139114 TaxID=3239931 RepID=UPI003D958E51
MAWRRCGLPRRLARHRLGPTPQLSLAARRISPGLPGRRPSGGRAHNIAGPRPVGESAEGPLTAIIRLGDVDDRAYSPTSRRDHAEHVRISYGLAGLAVCWGYAAMLGLAPAVVADVLFMLTTGVWLALVVDRRPAVVAGADSPAAHPQPGRPDRSDAALPAPVVVRLLAILAAAAGCLDAVCVTRLGSMFASVITGNLVQLGRGIATVDGRLAAGATTAVGGYALGVAIGTVGLLRCGTGWHRRTSVVTAAEVVLLAGMVAGWLATDAHPGPTTTPLLLGLAATAMGVQSAVTISSGEHGASTTYLTGTLTTVVRAVTVGPHLFAAGAGGVARMVALVCGAAVGALVLRVAPLWAPALPAVLVTAVVAAALTRNRMERS